MTDLGVRVLVIVIVGTALAGLFGWVTGSLLQGEARIEGIERVLIHTMLIVLYFFLLLGVWNLLKRITTQADTSKDVTQE